MLDLHSGVPRKDNPSRNFAPTLARKLPVLINLNNVNEIAGEVRSGSSRRHSIKINRETSGPSRKRGKRILNRISVLRRKRKIIHTYIPKEISPTARNVKKRALNFNGLKERNLFARIYRMTCTSEPSRCQTYNSAVPQR